MNIERVKKIADAVLYEGYILYPYRASAIKNHKRFDFGTLYPVGNESDEPCRMRTQCLVVGDAPFLEIGVRFLHLLNRDVYRLESPSKELSRNWESMAQLVASMSVNGTLYQTWQEAIEHEVFQSPPSLPDLVSNPFRTEFAFDTESKVESLIEGGNCVGAIRRSRSTIAGELETSCEPIGPQIFKVTVDLKNTSDSRNESTVSADEGMAKVLASAHMILSLKGGEFLSAIDPPQNHAEIASTCQNIGVWPVLVGDEGDRNCLLVSPIILYDYPQISPHSRGDFFDGTEIDEMLTLRVMTMTDQEKAEMRSVDERARQILERTEALSSAQMMALHGSSKAT